MKTLDRIFEKNPVQFRHQGALKLLRGEFDQVLSMFKKFKLFA